MPHPLQEADSKSAQNVSLVALCAFIPSILVILLGAWNWYTDIQADKTAKTTQGVVTQDDSRDYHYTYTVDGTEYSGEEIIKSGLPLSTSEDVRVTYRPEEPATSTLTPPFGDTDSRPVPMILAAVSGVYLCFCFRRFLIKRQSGNPYETR